MIGFDGMMNTNIIIRTLIFTRTHIYLQAGGGIVADSKPDMELMETMVKVGKVFESFEGRATSGEKKWHDPAHR
jgi:anthranilate/para-aminobenzoate synthase component I